MVSLNKILEIPSCSGMEDLMVEHIINFCMMNDLQYEVDESQNVYVTKGTPKEGEYYPCVVAHTDTVHFDQKNMIKNREKIKIIESIEDGKTRLYGHNTKTNDYTGIGGDDKCGIYICFKLLLDFDVIKAAFFVMEETGMQGSQKADPNFFKDVGYAIQFDGPTRNWFSKTLKGKNLWNETFLNDVKPLLEQYNVDNFSIDPWTDVLQLIEKFDFCCAVFPAGYYGWHTPYEYVIVEEVEECYQLGKESLNKLGNKKYTFNQQLITS
jgi:tripeptide aminopeptidase